MVNGDNKVASLHSMKIIPIASLVPQMPAVNLEFMVLEKGEIQTAANRRIFVVVKIADKTGSCQLTIWNEFAEFVRIGDICRLADGIVQVYKGKLGVVCGKNSKIMKFGEFFLNISEVPDVSTYKEEYRQYGKEISNL
ncbi:SOSS complex subunit B homolog [Strongyloides ratti]|uniref:SOSS complex subunit B homolog n=1 Tax=Strongyloides ratti TaxID=34506 RepID=A0A090MX07_STRRB|nr:SOSS complex subunit B homolog [Strongyloides ratti]CEF64604.1 SOSS complex subunit B homolog [Strongyloides ratti]